jgi:predicted negative regulator of RcsB-dependent stress response
MLVLVDNNAGADDEAEGVATALATTCPTSTSTVDTSVSVGDRAFERGEHVIAERHYRAALAVPGDPAHLRAYAGYRLAWVHLATGDLASARSELEAAQVIATDRLLRRELERSLAVVSDREAGVEAAPPPQQ